jgi:TatD DNase family protein
MTIIDSHSHIYLPEFDGDRALMLQRAKEEGVGMILMPAIDSATHEVQFKIEEEGKGHCFSMMGLHPCSVKENYRTELKIARDLFDHRKFSGVGEIGLDFYWDKTFIKEQYEALHEQLEWANHFDLAFSLHSRNATDECIEVVKQHQHGKLKGVFHCFSGDEMQAKKITEMGIHLGIGGVVTFRNGGLDRVLPHIDLQHIVLETDAPYLAPVPFRGKRNEPAYLKFIIERIAAIKNISADEVAEITTRNAGNLFLG